MIIIDIPIDHYRIDGFQKLKKKKKKKKKKIEFDGQPKNLLKMLQVITSINDELHLHGQQKFEESILKCVRSKQKDY